MKSHKSCANFGKGCKLHFLSDCGLCVQVKEKETCLDCYCSNWQERQVTFLPDFTNSKKTITKEGW